MIPSARALLWASVSVVVAFSAACNKEKAPATNGGSAPAAAAGSAPAAKMDPSTPVAEVAGEKITAGELDKQVGPQLEAMQAELEKQMFDARKQALDSMIIEKLVKAEAAKKSLTDEQWIAQEVDGKIAQPSDAEMQKMYEEAKARLPPGTSFETVKPQIAQYLTRAERQKTMSALFEKLKKDANVKVLLSQPRKQVAAIGPSKGPDDAKITIVEFSDFECPYCSKAEEAVKQVMDSYAGKVKLVFRHFPLNFHPNAQKAAEASACADDQGKFWALHEAMFANQRALGVDQLKGYAEKAGLDMTKFNQCLDTGAKAELVKKDMQDGSKVGVNGTPAFFINGIPLSGAVPFEQFKEVIDQELSAT